MKKTNEKKEGRGIWHCGVRAFCEHKTCLGAWLHLLLSGVKFRNIHTRPYLYHKVDWNVCAYCKKRRGEVEMEFSCIDGSICVNCSDKWHNNHPKALSKRETSLLLDYVDKWRNKNRI